MHVGGASISKSKRYDGFSFAQPAAGGELDHKRLEGKTLILDVGEIASEMKDGVVRWIRELEGNPSSVVAVNAALNLPSLIQVRKFPHPSVLDSLGSPVIVNRSS